jgi:hypothetical protein
LHAQKYGIFLERQAYSRTESACTGGKDTGICFIGQLPWRWLSLFS